MAITLGRRSLAHLSTCDERIQRLVHAASAEAPAHLDFAVLCGYRDEDEQEEAFRRGASKVRFPNSKHNTYPSLAVDIAPYPLVWDDLFRFARLMGFIENIAWRQGLGPIIRFGHDFNQSGRTDDKFVDWPHIELSS